MAKWKKLGRVFDPRDHRDASRPWLHEYAQAPATMYLMIREGLFFMPSASG